MHDAFEPGCSCLFVEMLDRATGMGKLIEAHGSIADKDDLVVGCIGMQNLPGFNRLVMAAAIALPYLLVKAIVEVEIFHMLEFGTRRREQFLAQANERIHRAADIEE